jgi:hypothetical protein
VDVRGWTYPAIMAGMEDPLFVPAEFIVPSRLEGPGFVLRPLVVDDNDGDLDAWSTSADHIHATPGFEGHPWPDEPMTLERNHEDLQGHVDDYAARRGFTYTVERDGETIGCVYIYPSKSDGVDVNVRSWVRASHADEDIPLYTAVNQWIVSEWPFDVVEYAGR